MIVGASVGIAIARDDERDPDQLLKNADMALYRAKADGRAHLPLLRARDGRAPAGAAQLEQGPARRLQRPTSSSCTTSRRSICANNDVIGFEALLRWRHPERGMVSPAEFIPIAEEIGLIVPLGEWVLDTACADAADWPSRITRRRQPVAGPVPQRQDRRDGEAARLPLSGLSPGRLELEITETVLLQDNDVNLATLHELTRLGVRIAMDDFGTGYSSLSYLRRFPFDKIKIDRSFVKELPHDPDCLTIIRGIVGLAAGLGMTTTAEGVEKPSQLEVLRAYGCHEAQGFLFGRAAPASEIERMLAGEAASVGTAA